MFLSNEFIISFLDFISSSLFLIYSLDCAIIELNSFFLFSSWDILVNIFPVLPLIFLPLSCFFFALSLAFNILSEPILVVYVLILSFIFDKLSLAILCSFFFDWISFFASSISLLWFLIIDSKDDLLILVDVSPSKRLLLLFFILLKVDWTSSFSINLEFVLRLEVKLLNDDSLLLSSFIFEKSFRSSL